MILVWVPILWLSCLKLQGLHEMGFEADIFLVLRIVILVKEKKRKFCQNMFFICKLSFSFLLFAASKPHIRHIVLQVLGSFRPYILLLFVIVLHHWV